MIRTRMSRLWEAARLSKRWHGAPLETLPSRVRVRPVSPLCRGSSRLLRCRRGPRATQVPIAPPGPRVREDWWVAIHVTEDLTSYCDLDTPPRRRTRFPCQSRQRRRQMVGRSHCRPGGHPRSHFGSGRHHRSRCSTSSGGGSPAARRIINWLGIPRTCCTSEPTSCR